MSTTSNLNFLRTNLLDDGSSAIWGTAELYDDMAIETAPYSCLLSRVGGTATYFESAKPFWLPIGTGDGQAPDLDILFNGTALGTASYSLDYLCGRVSLTTPSTLASDEVTATFYACNLWAVAQTALLRRMNSTSISGEKKSIRLGPLSKSVTGPSEMVLSFNGRINAFARFAQRYRSASTQTPRVRL
jgi:hypothetical protein